MKMGNNLKSQSGFMLIEVIASIILTFAFVSVFFPFVSQLLSYWNSGRSELDKVDILTTGFVRLSDDFSTAFPLEPNDDPAKAHRIFFYGDKKTIFFVRIATEAGINPQLEEVGFEISETSQGMSLIRRHILLNGTIPKMPSKDMNDLENPVSIITNKNYIEFNFIKHNNDQKSEWTADSEMPKQVLITVSDDKSRDDRKLFLDLFSDSQEIAWYQGVVSKIRGQTPIMFEKPSLNRVMIMC